MVLHFRYIRNSICIQHVPVSAQKALFKYDCVSVTRCGCLLLTIMSLLVFQCWHDILVWWFLRSTRGRRHQTTLLPTVDYILPWRQTPRLYSFACTSLEWIPYLDQSLNLSSASYNPWINLYSRRRQHSQNSIGLNRACASLQRTSRQCPFHWKCVLAAGQWVQPSAKSWRSSVSSVSLPWPSK